MSSARKQGCERVYGPYCERGKWRVITVAADGTRATKGFATESEASQFIADIRAEVGERTVGVAVEEWLRSPEAARVMKTGNSITTARYRLSGLLGLPRNAERSITSLTVVAARELYAQRVTKVAADTHRGELGYAKRWGAWLVAHGWLRVNPFATIEPQGDRRAGKPQLRVDEARRFIAAALADQSAEATAVLVAVMMGLRAHEIVERVVRDLDDGGRLLIIPKSKTRAGVRTVVVPPTLRGRLLSLAAGRRADERLFKFSRHALHYHAVRLSLLAGVPRVTPHGLRGTFTTLAVVAGLPGYQSDAPHGESLTVEQTARLVGHADSGSTARRHYLAPGAEQSADVAKVERVIGPSVIPVEKEASDFSETPNQEDLN